MAVTASFRGQTRREIRGANNGLMARSPNGWYDLAADVAATRQ